MFIAQWMPARLPPSVAGVCFDPKENIGIWRTRRYADSRLELNRVGEGRCRRARQVGRACAYPKYCVV